MVIGLGIIGLMVLSFLLVSPSYTGFAVTSINTCSDTDGGKVYNVTGMVWGEYYLTTKITFSSQDECLNEKYLIEYFCQGEPGDTREKSELVACPQGCSEGRCTTNTEQPHTLSFFEKVKVLFGR